MKVAIVKANFNNFVGITRLWIKFGWFEQCVANDRTNFCYNICSKLFASCRNTVHEHAVFSLQYKKSFQTLRSNSSSSFARIQMCCTYWWLFVDGAWWGMLWWGMQCNFCCCCRCFWTFSSTFLSDSLSVSVSLLSSFGWEGVDKRESIQDS